MSVPVLSNAHARRLFLHRHLLAEAPTGPVKPAGVADLITRLGFVQVDSINTVARAHHMILWSRRQSYRPDMLPRPLERDRTAWEHWTHDASILPMGLYPHWQHRFTRDADRLRANWRRWFREGYEAQLDTLLHRIETDGPVTTAEVGEGEVRGKGGWWDWHPSKTALEWLWRTGRLAITRRDSFRKVYDLTERVVPEALRAARIPAQDHIHWACTSALEQLGFGTPQELQAYWNAISGDEAKAWARDNLASGALLQVDIQGADGRLRPGLIRPEVLQTAPALPPAPDRLRILSPFDPALRDRNRAERLFGFYYRIEVFVPEAQRTYGYYVFPVLEGEALIGRLDAKADRTANTLRIRAFWPEPGISPTKRRLARLEAELLRLAKLADCDQLAYAPDWLRSPVPPTA